MKRSLEKKKSEQECRRRTVADNRLPKGSLPRPQQRVGIFQDRLCRGNIATQYSILHISTRTFYILYIIYAEPIDKYYQPLSGKVIALPHDEIIRRKYFETHS